MVGTISNIVIARRFGFISGDDGREYFFHMEDMETNWDELVSDFAAISKDRKIRVTFTQDKTSKGPRARKVSIFEV